MEWKPDIVITPKTILSVASWIVALIVMVGTTVWTSSSVYNKIDTRLTSLENTRELRTSQIKDIQAKVLAVDTKMVSSEANQDAIMAQLKSIQADQRIIFRQLMKDRSAFIEKNQPTRVRF